MGSRCIGTISAREPIMAIAVQLPMKGASKMNHHAVRTTFVIATLLVLTLSAIDHVWATELQFEQKKLNKVNPKEVITSGKKRGPAPPADPQCPIGSSPVGPVTHSTESRSCKIDGKDGTKNCYHKMVACLSGPGEQEYAFSENCGPCVAFTQKSGTKTTRLSL